MRKVIKWDTQKVREFLQENTNCILDENSEYVNMKEKMTFICGCEKHEKFTRPFANILRNYKHGVEIFCNSCRNKRISSIFTYDDQTMKKYFLEKFNIEFLYREDSIVILRCACGNEIRKLFRNCQSVDVIPKCEECVELAYEQARYNLGVKKAEELLLKRNVKAENIKFGKNAEDSIFIIKCIHCGEEMRVSYPTLYSANRNIVSNGDICKNCLHKISNSKFKLDFNKLETRMEELNYILVSKKEEYKNENSDIYFYCKKHIEEGIMSSKWGTLRVTGGCSFCRWEKVAYAKHQTPEGYKTEFDKKCGHVLELMSDYINSATKIKVKDKRCGTILMMLPWNALNLDFYCPRCSGSRMENRVSLILEDMGKPNYPQHSFEDCVNISKLRFDFIVYKDEAEQEIEMLIEAQGPQHERPVSFGQKDEDKMMEAFYLGLERDKIKKQYCEENNIRLLELWYYDYKDFEKILRKELERETL